MHEFSLVITPIPKPRQTQRDKWMKRPCVMRYRQYKDDLKAAGIKPNPDGFEITFKLPMPQSWSKKKKAAMDTQPHQQKPDIDNLLKGFMDALFEDDSGIHWVKANKIWGKTGGIKVVGVQYDDSSDF